MELCAKIDGLWVAFNKEPALCGVSADIPKEGVTVLLGRSGSGKTTLLRSLNRLNESFPGYEGGGSVQVRLGGALTNVYGSDAPDLTYIRRSAGMVFQTPNPLPLSLAKNITMPLELVLGLSRAEAARRMEKSLREVGLWDEVKDRLNQRAASFSGGQQQRLCLARTLAMEPDLLLLDEPTASLDRKSTELIEEHLMKLKERIPMIMVSHSLTQAKKLGEHFIVMGEGRIIKKLSKDELPKEEGEAFLETLL
ncbi:MAG: phosphate ABC transporter ATP-binding protein [Cloacibacillus sp.]